MKKKSKKILEKKLKVAIKKVLSSEPGTAFKKMEKTIKKSAKLIVKKAEKKAEAIKRKALKKRKASKKSSGKKKPPSSVYTIRDIKTAAAKPARQKASGK
ncbi:MAG: hypothetical protein ACHQNT_09430 [Bacteroidia bacterium]